jgi:hypothetical protein
MTTVATFLNHQVLEINFPFHSSVKNSEEKEEDKDDLLKVENRKIVSIDLKSRNFYPDNHYSYLVFLSLPSTSLPLFPTKKESNYLLNIFDDGNGHSKWIYLRVILSAKDDEDEEVVSVLTKEIKLVDVFFKGEKRRKKKFLNKIYFIANYPGKPNWFFAKKETRFDKRRIDDEAYLIKIDDYILSYFSTSSLESGEVVEVNVEKFPSSSLQRFVDCDYSGIILEEYLNWKKSKTDTDRDDKDNNHVDIHCCYYVPPAKCECKNRDGSDVKSILSYNMYCRQLCHTIDQGKKEKEVKTMSYGTKVVDDRIYTCVYTRDKGDADDTAERKNFAVEEISIDPITKLMRARRVIIPRPINSTNHSCEFQCYNADSVLVKMEISETETYTDSFDYSLTVLVNFFQETYEVIDKKLWDDTRYHDDRCHHVIENVDDKFSSLVKKLLANFLLSPLTNIIISFF